jgi:hypothetical protein
MDLINNWKKIAGMNSPMLPGQPPGATPPFMPVPGQQGYQPANPSTPFGKKGPLQPIKPTGQQKVGVDQILPGVQTPEREKIGMDQILPEMERQSQFTAEGLQPVEVDAEKRSGMIDKPWYKDGNFMNELGGRLGNAFGGLTLRGNSQAETMMNAQKIKQAQAGRESNKSMDFLIRENPELAKKLMALPPEQRAKFMPMAIAQGAGLQTGKESAFAEKVRMLEESGVPRDQALSQVLSGSGTNISVTTGGGTKPFEQELGTKAAEWYGKRNKAYSDINDLDRVIGVIETAQANGDQLSGGIINFLPDDAKDLFNPQGQDVRRSVEKVIQASLKETLGAQFAEREGRQIFERTWNPKAPMEYNLRRVRQLHGELNAYAQGQDALMNGMLESDGNILQYMRDNKDMSFSNPDAIRYLEYADPIDAGINPEPASSGSGGPPAGIDPAIWAEMDEEQRALFQ